MNKLTLYLTANQTVKIPIEKNENTFRLSELVSKISYLDNKKRGIQWYENLNTNNDIGE